MTLRLQVLNTVISIFVFLLIISCHENSGTAVQIFHKRVIIIENSIGVITLSENYTKNDTVKIYNVDGSLWYKFTYYNQKDMELSNKEFIPFAFHPDYFLLVLKVTDTIGDNYQVVVNEHNGLKKYVKKNDSTLRFLTWTEHILNNVFAVTFDPNVNPIREMPNNNAREVTFDDTEIYQPYKIQEDWLQIRWGDTSRWNYGWIRWKENEKLLIELYYFM